MWLVKSLIILAAGTSLAEAITSKSLYKPSTWTQDNQTQVLPVHNETVFHLSSNGSNPSIVILDYGKDVEGIPTFRVSQHHGDTSRFEITYSETLSLLDSYMGDGPLTLAAAMDTYRVNRYNITATGLYKSELVQGGLRYQKLNLSTAGEIEISHPGLIPTTDVTPISQLPGSFNCSDSELTRIWQTGARTVQLSELPAHSVPEFWKITPDGAFVHSAAPQPWAGSDLGSTLMQYTLKFSAKPTAGGFGFTVLSDTLGSGIFIFVDAESRSISAHVGSTERDSAPLASMKLNSTVSYGTWHSVIADVNMTDITISIDGHMALKFSQTSSFLGSFGLGASFGQAVYYSNVSLTTGGREIYKSSLADKSALNDFLLGTNPLPVLVDGSRRDRIAYAGDLETAALSSFASTNGRKFVNGTLELMGSFQLTPGFFAPTAKIQQLPRTEEIQANITGLIGYSFSLAATVGDYYSMTAEPGFASRWAPRILRLLDWADSQTVPVQDDMDSNKLLNVSNTLGGGWNYYDPAQSGMVMSFNAIYAFALQQCLPLLSFAGIGNLSTYETRLRDLRHAINTNFWNEELGAYGLSLSRMGIISQEANALAILANVPTAGNNSRSSASVLSAMKRHLSLPASGRPLAFSNSSVSAGFEQKVSPYASGYHLRAALYANDSTTAQNLLTSLWAPMADPAATNYTGCFWETLLPEGTPGLGGSTSLCHAWSSGPTAALSQYVLGVQPVDAGFDTWKVAPQTLELSWAEGLYPTPHGPVAVKWAYDAMGALKMKVSGPVGTQGIVKLSLRPGRTTVDNIRYKVSGNSSAITSELTFAVNGGSTFHFQQL
ncbi:bacterial alpha-L-rhamnosidase domain protein [Penicillium brevicompactum]|uniref:bacterial alpha-L-rhamnosidase domain protein n=1 Tax=Penicillium brevicompactum TaxID=5074 RepID=UPI00253F90B4|nr:bacterial alpha-L-rhamnosidase domain protein [Penicillium brevicompactum]KAJ5319034.1 bacterial alpha-L-rhamnosidase domain protein [Penicillium brevicompactum]